MNSISNISIFPEINSTSIWQTLVDNVLNGIAYLFAAILSTRARKIETAPVGVLQNTSAIETVLDIYGNAILRLAYSYLHNMFHPQLGVKLCSMAGGGVQKIYMVLLREPSRRDRSGSDLFHLRDGFEIKMNFDRNVSCFIFVNAFMHDDFFY